MLQPSLKSAKPTCLPDGVSNMESVLGGRAVVAFVTTIRLNELLRQIAGLHACFEPADGDLSAIAQAQSCGYGSRHV